MLQFLFAPFLKLLRELRDRPLIGSYWHAEHVENVATSGGTRVHLDHLSKVLSARRARYLYDPDIESARLIEPDEPPVEQVERSTHASTMERVVGRRIMQRGASRR